MEINLMKVRKALAGWGWWILILVIVYFAWDALKGLDDAMEAARHVCRDLAGREYDECMRKSEPTSIERIAAWASRAWFATLIALFAPPLTVAAIRNSPLGTIMMPGSTVVTAERARIRAKQKGDEPLTPEEANVLHGIAIRNGLWLLAYMVFAHGLLGRL